MSFSQMSAITIFYVVLICLAFIVSAFLFLHSGDIDEEYEKISHENTGARLIWGSKEKKQLDLTEQDAKFRSNFPQAFLNTGLNKMFRRTRAYYITQTHEETPHPEANILTYLPPIEKHFAIKYEYGEILSICAPEPHKFPVSAKLHKLRIANFVQDFETTMRDLTPVDFVLSCCAFSHLPNFSVLEFNARVLSLIFARLKNGGDMLYLHSFRWDVKLLANTLFVLSKCFENVQCYRGEGLMSPIYPIVAIYAQKFKKSAESFWQTVAKKYAKNEQLYDEEFPVSKKAMINGVYHDINKDLLDEIQKLV